MTLRVRQKSYGLMLHEEDRGHTKGLACVWPEAGGGPDGAHWHVFRAVFGDDKPVSLGDNLEEFAEERFITLRAALLWATHPVPVRA